MGAVAVLAGTAIDFVWYRDVGYPDSASLLRMRDLAQHGAVYPNPNQPPYLVSLYGPLFYIVLGLPWRITQDIDTARYLVRAAVIGFWLMGLVLVYHIARRVSGSVAKGAIAVAFALSAPTIAHWTTQVRGDLMGIGFSLLGIYWVLGEAGYGRLIAAGLCAALALFSKQTFLAAPCAILVFFAAQRRWRYMLTFGVAAVGGSALGYGVEIWREPYAWTSLTLFSRPIYRFRSGMALAGDGLWNAAPAVALIGGLIAIRRGRVKGEEALLLLYCIFSWALSLISIVQVGGSTNYFIEPLMASAIVASIYLNDFENALVMAPRVMLIPAFIVLFLFSAPLWKRDADLLRDSWFRTTHYTAFRRDWTEFTASIANRRLLSSYPDVTIYSRPPEVPDALLNSMLADQGRWNWAPVIAAIDRSDYDLLAMYPFFLKGSGQYRDFRYWNEDFFKAVLRDYTLAGLCAGMEIWTPRHPRQGGWKYLESEGCRGPAGN